jgi:hypothetical protein
MPTIEIDLHIQRLLDNLSGLNNADMLEYQIDTFKKTLEKHKKYKGWRIVFIHGQGKGKLKNSIESILKKSYKQYDFQDASTIDPFKYQMGTAIVVIIK